MKTRIAAYLILFPAFWGCARPVSAEVTGLKAFCREGQTFLTWQEDGADWYYVYASAAPIKTTDGLTWIAKIPKGLESFPSSIRAPMMAGPTAGIRRGQPSPSPPTPMAMPAMTDVK